jgi:hypothetical protein
MIFRSFLSWNFVCLLSLLIGSLTSLILGWIDFSSLQKIDEFYCQLSNSKLKAQLSSTQITSFSSFGLHLFSVYLLIFLKVPFEGLILFNL